MALGNIIGAIEIGTAKVAVLVGEILSGQTLNIIGFGQSASQGITKGEIVDLSEASACTHAAITAAEANAGTSIECVLLAQTGSHLQGFSNTGSVPVVDPDNIVSQADIDRAAAEAKDKRLHSDRVYLDHIRRGFCLDKRSVAAPLGMRGERLDVDYWHIHGDKRKISDAFQIINGFGGLNVDGLIASSVASGCMAASEEERASGVVVIDMGCGTTDYVVYRDGYIWRTGVIPVGGDHLTNDLALGLRTNRKYAEDMKLKYGKATLDPSEKSEKIWLIGDRMIGDRMVPHKAIVQILNARLEEIFRILRNEVAQCGDVNVLAAGAILTGGSSHLSGIETLAAQVLGVPTRVGLNPSWLRSDLRGPDFTTTLGLLHYALKNAETGFFRKTQKGFFKRALDFLSFT